jgi:hypothetical protein
MTISLDSLIGEFFDQQVLRVNPKPVTSAPTPALLRRSFGEGDRTSL